MTILPCLNATLSVVLSVYGESQSQHTFCIDITVIL